MVFSPSPKLDGHRYGARGQAIQGPHARPPGSCLPRSSFSLVAARADACYLKTRFSRLRSTCSHAILGMVLTLLTPPLSSIAQKQSVYLLQCTANLVSPIGNADKVKSHHAIKAVGVRAKLSDSSSSFVHPLVLKYLILVQDLRAVRLHNLHRIQLNRARGQRKPRMGVRETYIKRPFRSNSDPCPF